MKMNKKKENENDKRTVQTFLILQTNIVNILSNYMFGLFEISRSWNIYFIEISCWRILDVCPYELGHK